MWQAVELLRRLPQGGHVDARWDADKDAFTGTSTTSATSGLPQPRRDTAVGAARRLATLERLQADATRAQRAFDDPLVMAEYRLTGEAFAGPVDRRRARPAWTPAGRRRELRPHVTVETCDPVLVEPGAVLTSPGPAPARRRGWCRCPPAGARRTRVVLELSGRHGPRADRHARQRARRSARSSATRRSATVTSGPPAFPDPAETPWTHGGPPLQYVPSDEDAQEEWS